MKKIFTLLTALFVCILIGTNSYAVSVVIQPDDTNGTDTWIDLSNPSYPYGTWSYMHAYTIYRFPLIKFNISSVPSSATITNAVMELYAFSVDGSNPSVTAYKVTSAWDEDTVWNNKPTIDTSSNILNSGGQIVVDTWASWDITNLVQDWNSGAYPNYGVELNTLSTSTVVAFWASDTPTHPDLRPKLTITYNEQVIPEPATLILLGIGLIGVIRKKFVS